VVRYGDENLTALGNSVVSNNFSALIGPVFQKLIRKNNVQYLFFKN